MKAKIILLLYALLLIARTIFSETNYKHKKPKSKIDKEKNSYVITIVVFGNEKEKINILKKIFIDLELHYTIDVMNDRDMSNSNLINVDYYSER